MFKRLAIPQGASQVMLVVKNPPTIAGDIRDSGLISVLGRSAREGHGNPLQYSFPGESPWTEEPGGLQSVGSQRVRHDQSNLAHAHQGAGGDRGKGPPKHLRVRSQGPVRHRTTLSKKLSLALHTIPASECLSLPDG